MTGRDPDSWKAERDCRELDEENDRALAEKQRLCSHPNPHPASGHCALCGKLTWSER